MRWSPWGADPRLVRLAFAITVPAGLYLNASGYRGAQPLPIAVDWAVLAVWAGVLIFWARGQIAAAIRRPTLGCGYCANRENVREGNLAQEASDAAGSLLVACPRCHSLYSVSSDGLYATKRLTQTQARAAFPEWRPARDIR